MTKREFLAASVGAGLALGKAGSAFAQQAVAAAPRAAAKIPSRTAKTTKLFKSPPGFPNGIAVVPEGLWIAEQKESGALAVTYHLPEPKDLSEAAWLVDWHGKLLKTVTTPGRNTSGLAVGGGYIWMGANALPSEANTANEGIFQVDMNSKLVSHRQIPLGPADNGGGCHGLFWHDDKLWIASLRMNGILRVDPTTWEPEFFIPFYAVEGRPRYHGIAWDDGTIWLVTGNDSHSYSEGRPGLVRYEAATGKVLETADFAPGSADPHGLAMHDGVLVSCDAGIHPGWTPNDSPTHGWIFKIELV